MAQEQSLPFAEIPPAPNHYDPAALIARTVEGLGFRYYWASLDLRKEDLAYRPSEKGKSTLETIEHLYSLSETIFKISQNEPNIRPPQGMPKDYISLRKETLLYLQKAAQTFRNMPTETMASLEVIFEIEGKKSSYPLWHLLNGPLADALYHTGQVVSFRRSSGNPIASGVNVFLGKKIP